MTADQAKEHLTKQAGDPATGYVDAPDARLAIDQVYDDMPVNLDDLGDVNTSGQAAGDALVWDGTGWRPYPRSALDDLSDVDLTGQTSGHILKYNGSTWAPADPPGATTDLDDLADVTVPSPAVNEVLGWNGSAWVPQTKSATAEAGVYSVATYGAAGDGTTDDTAEIQATLDAVPATGGTVVFPKGSYLISAPLTVKSYTHIRGAERSSRYWTYSSSLPTSVCNLRVVDGFTGAAVLSLPSGRTAISVEGVTILGRNVGSVHGISGVISGTEHSLVLKNVGIIGMGGNGITGGFYAARFDSVYIGGCQGWGMAATERFSDVFVHNSYVAGNKAGGLYLAGSGNSGLCTFSQCRFERSGFDSNNPTTPSNTSAPGIYIRRLVDSSFIACQTDGNTGNGVDIGTASGANFYNVHFTSCDFRRDGMGTAQGSAPGEFAAIKIVSTAELSHVSFVDCTTQHAKASDAQAYPDYTHPKYGVWLQNTSLIRFLSGRYQGQSKAFYTGGGTLASGVYRPQMFLQSEGYLTLPLGSTRPADPLQGMMFWDTGLNPDRPIWWNGTAWVNADGIAV